MIQARLAQRALCPAQHVVDQGYMSASHLVSSAQQGIWLLGPLPPDTRNASGYQQADFVVDEAQQQVRCPQGHLSVVWRRAQRQTEPARPPPLQVRFAAATCQACPAFGVCTSSPKGRSLELHPLWAVMQRQRALMASPLYQRLLQVRAGVEGTIAEVTGALGLRRARYRGRAKLGLQCYFTAVALNLKRLIRWWTDPRRAGQAGSPSLTSRPAVA